MARNIQCECEPNRFTCSYCLRNVISGDMTSYNPVFHSAGLGFVDEAPMPNANEQFRIQRNDDMGDAVRDALK